MSTIILNHNRYKTTTFIDMDDLIDVGNEEICKDFKYRIIMCEAEHLNGFYHSVGQAIDLTSKYGGYVVDRKQNQIIYDGKHDRLL